MIRIAGVQLPEQKRIDFALTKVYGVGRRNVRQLLEKAKIAPSTKTKNLSKKEVINLQKAIDTLQVEGDLRQAVSQNIKRLKTIKCYRGIRHVKNLPVRGQRTRSNARTKRGKRVTIGAMKKDVRAKMDKQQKQQKLKEEGKSK